MAGYGSDGLAQESLPELLPVCCPVSIGVDLLLEVDELLQLLRAVHMVPDGGLYKVPDPSSPLNASHRRFGTLLGAAFWNISLTNSQPTQDGPVLRAAVRRYLDCWLPLLADKKAHGALVPPLDVAWVSIAARSLSPKPELRPDHLLPSLADRPPAPLPIFPAHRCGTCTSSPRANTLPIPTVFSTKSSTAAPAQAPSLSIAGAPWSSPAWF